MGGSAFGSQCDVFRSERCNGGAVSGGIGGETCTFVKRVLLMGKIGAFKASTAGGRGLLLPPFLVCNGKINLEVHPGIIGVCLALPELTVVVE